MHCCEVVFTNRVGPLVLAGAGHFLQWERADVFNPTVAVFFAGLKVLPGVDAGGGPMSRFDHLDGRTPVVVGAAEVVHRAGDGFVPTSATELMLEATQDALASSGAAAALGPLVGEVLVPHGTWAEPDPGRALAVAIGAPGRPLGALRARGAPALPARSGRRRRSPPASSRPPSWSAPRTAGPVWCRPRRADRCPSRPTRPSPRSPTSSSSPPT